MKKKLLFLAVLALLGAFILTGCTGGGEGKETGAESDTSAGTESGTYETKDGKFEFETLNSKVKASFGDGGMTVTSLVTSDGYEWAESPLEYDFFGSIEGYSWKYQGAEVTSADGIKTVTAKFTSGKGLDYQATVTARKNYAVLEIGGRFLNSTGSGIDVKLPNSFRTALKNSEGLTATAYRKESGAAEGYSKYKKPGTGSESVLLTEGQSLRADTRVISDWNANGNIPLLILHDGTRGILFGFESCDCCLEAKAESNSRFTLTASLSVGAFSTVITDKLEIPPVYLGAYVGSEDGGSNLFKRWYFDVKSPAKLKEDPAEPLIQGGSDAKLNTLHTLGFQSINIDYGWWTDEKEKSLEGSWELRNTTYSNRLGGSFKQFGKTRKALARNVTNFTAYVLLHDTTLPDGSVTDQYGEFNSVTHPDWFSSRKVSAGACADLGNVACVEYLKNALPEFLISADAKTWRSDFEPIAARSDLANRHKANGTDVPYWCSVGFYDLMDTLYEKIPGFRYECCSQGGSMKDYATLRYATVINAEDTWNYLSCRMVFWDSSWCIPPAQLQLNCCVESFCVKSNAVTNYGRLYHVETPVDENAEGFDRRMQEYGIRSTLMGVPGFNSVESASRFGCDDLLKKYVGVYQTKIRDLVKYGELYHILPRPDGINWDGVMYADPDAQGEVKGLIFLFKPSNKQGKTMHITPEGLDADTVYSLVFEDRTEQNREVKGADLMKDGLDVTINEELGSEMIWIYAK